jgi:hypothetical protein
MIGEQEERKKLKVRKVEKDNGRKIKERKRGMKARKNKERSEKGRKESWNERKKLRKNK